MPSTTPPFRAFLASDTEIRDLLRGHRTVLVVGPEEEVLPPELEQTLAALRQYGYRVILHQAAPSGSSPLDHVKEKLEIVVAAAPRPDLPEIVAAAAERKANVLWFGRDVGWREIAYDAYKRGLKVVLNRDIITEYEMHFPDDELGYPLGAGD